MTALAISENVSPKILIVDDSAVAHGMLAPILKKSGMEFVSALNIEEADEYLRLYRGSLVGGLIDLHIGEDCGFEYVNKVHGDYPNLEIFGFSSLDDSKTEERVVENGGNRLVSKSAGRDAILSHLMHFTKLAPQPSVLVVDDSKVALKKLSKQLKQVDVGSLSAVDTAQADELLLKYQLTISCVIVDVHLGQSCGLEYITKLSKQYPHLVIYAYSSSDDNITEQRAKNSGAVGLVSKDLAPKEALKFLSQLKEIPPPPIAETNTATTAEVQALKKQVDKLESLLKTKESDPATGNIPPDFLERLKSLEDESANRASKSVRAEEINIANRTKAFINEQLIVEMPQLRKKLRGGVEELIKDIGVERFDDQALQHLVESKVEALSDTNSAVTSSNPSLDIDEIESIIASYFENNDINAANSISQESTLSQEALAEVFSNVERFSEDNKQLKKQLHEFKTNTIRQQEVINLKLQSNSGISSSVADISGVAKISSQDIDGITRTIYNMLDSDLENVRSDMTMEIDKVKRQAVDKALSMVTPENLENRIGDALQASLVNKVSSKVQKKMLGPLSARVVGLLSPRINTASRMSWLPAVFVGILLVVGYIYFDDSYNFADLFN